MPTFKVMTWNVENLFRPGQAPTALPAADYQAKVDLLATTISRLGPDVLAFQEIGSDSAFQDLRQALGKKFEHARLSTHADGRGIRVGFISQLPIDDDEEIVDFPPGPALDVHDIDADGHEQPLNKMGRGGPCACASTRVALGSRS
jgi:hypothetical protein